jgi:hypothetical protein
MLVKYAFPQNKTDTDNPVFINNIKQAIWLNNDEILINDGFYYPGKTRLLKYLVSKNRFVQVYNGNFERSETVAFSRSGKTWFVLDNKSLDFVVKNGLEKLNSGNLKGSTSQRDDEGSLEIIKDIMVGDNGDILDFIVRANDDVILNMIPQNLFIPELFNQIQSDGTTIKQIVHNTKNGNMYILIINKQNLTETGDHVCQYIFKTIYQYSLYSKVLSPVISSLPDHYYTVEAVKENGNCIFLSSFFVYETEPFSGSCEIPERYPLPTLLAYNKKNKNGIT